MGDAGNRLSSDGTTLGRLKVKGPFVAGEYFRGEGGGRASRDDLCFAVLERAI